MENSINLIVHLSESDKVLLGKLLSAAEALNASLLANQGMIAIADTDTPTEGTSRPATPSVAKPVKDIDPNAGAAVATLGDVQRKVVELCGPAHGKKQKSGRSSRRTPRRSQAFRRTSWTRSWLN